MIFLCCLERNKTWKSKQRSEKGIAHRPKKSEKQHTKQWKKELYLSGEAEYLANIATE